MAPVTLGIDPGLSGALAIIGPGGLLIMDMPTLQPSKRRVIDEIELARMIDSAGTIDIAYLELVGTRPGEGAVGAFAFGKGYGVIRGILRAHFIPIVDVTPRKWKAAVGIPAGAGKDASRAKAKEVFQHEAGMFARVKDDGRAEAALIAHYGWTIAGERVAHDLTRSMHTDPSRPQTRGADYGPGRAEALRVSPSRSSRA